MKRWRRRLFYSLAVIVWLAIVSFPFFAFMLATQREIRVGGSDRRHLRLFLIQEEETQGVGVEYARPYPGSDECAQTTVTYLLWQGMGENVTYCQCLESESGELTGSAQRCLGQ